MDGDTVQRLRMLAHSLWGRAAHDSEAALGASFDVPLTESEYRVFAEIGGSLRLNPSAWSFLRDLITQVDR